MAIPIPNSNITPLGGLSVHENNDPRFLEYRKEWMENPKQFIVREFPVHLDIEITNRCNLKCTFCDKLPYLKKEQIGDMDFPLFKKIIDEGKKNDLRSIKLSYRGEPLIHPQVAEMVAYAVKNDVVDIYFNTNAMLLTTKMSQKLIDAGLNRISISIEGTDPGFFEKERKGANFEKIRQNIRKLKELREKAGSVFPKIRLQTVRLPHIDLKEYAEFWAPYCDETSAIDYKDAEVRNTSIVDEDWSCPQLWQRMTIEWDGTIMPCNNDDYRLLSPGNVNQIGVKDAWHAKNVTDARRSHKKGKSHQLEACNGCPWRATQIMKKRL